MNLHIKGEKKWCNSFLKKRKKGFKLTKFKYSAIKIDSITNHIKS